MAIHLHNSEFFQVIKREVAREDFNAHDIPETHELLASYTTLEEANRHAKAEARKIGEHENERVIPTRIAADPGLYSAEISIWGSEGHRGMEKAVIDVERIVLKTRFVKEEYDFDEEEEEESDGSVRFVMDETTEDEDESDEVEEEKEDEEDEEDERDEDESEMEEERLESLQVVKLTRTMDPLALAEARISGTQPHLLGLLHPLTNLSAMNKFPLKGPNTMSTDQICQKAAEGY